MPGLTEGDRRRAHRGLSPAAKPESTIRPGKGVCVWWGWEG